MTIYVHFVEKVTQRHRDLENTLDVWRHKVQSELEWLIENNVLYRNMKYGKEGIDALPCDNVLDGIYNTITIGVNMVEDESFHDGISQWVLRIMSCRRVVVILKNQDLVMIHI